MNKIEVQFSEGFQMTFVGFQTFGKWPFTRQERTRNVMPVILMIFFCDNSVNTTVLIPILVHIIKCNCNRIKFPSKGIVIYPSSIPPAVIQLALGSYTPYHKVHTSPVSIIHHITKYTHLQQSTATSYINFCVPTSWVQDSSARTSCSKHIVLWELH